LIHEDDTFFGCDVDHVISEKHGGLTAVDNLAWACLLCNRAKGSDIGSISAKTAALTRLFNPRLDYWSEPFKLDVFSSYLSRRSARSLSEFFGLTLPNT
jgi:hypothetical protein